MAEATDVRTLEIINAVGVLWPHGRVHLVQGRAAADKTFWLVPNGRHPKLLLDVSNPRAAASALSSYSSALSLSQRLVRAAGAVAMRSGIGRRLLRDSLAVEAHSEPDQPLEEYLEGILGEPVVIAVGLGTRRANRKPVLLLMDRFGSTIAYVKVGHNAATAPLVRREAENLRLIGSRTWNAIRPPDLLGIGTWNGLDILIISGLPTAFWDLRGRQAAPRAAMDELATAFGAAEVPFGDSPFIQRVDLLLGQLQHEQARDRLELVRDTLVKRFDDLGVRMGAWHGDWAPWNMSRVRGRVALWDWEQFSTEVPIGLDLVHYFVNTQTRRSGFTLPVIMGVLRSPHVQYYQDPEMQEMLVNSYLVAIASRYLASAEQFSGELIRPQAGVVLDVLENRLDLGVGEGRP